MVRVRKKDGRVDPWGLHAEKTGLIYVSESSLTNVSRDPFLGNKELMRQGNLSTLGTLSRDPHGFRLHVDQMALDRTGLASLELEDLLFVLPIRTE